jgi:hypothetical protein
MTKLARVKRKVMLEILEITEVLQRSQCPAWEPVMARTAVAFYRTLSR